ncbi:retrovirus-related pol polyprotein from transposon TNT 1-94 [Tanacetum coccineum]|uniref:Retrovirus-related pol polyprotein from transposon TNT 1-94 n=1 Tax=Tanacetum coccineum TaxID=301880 RepID=A0ABQ5ATX0_9ASTR
MCMFALTVSIVEPKNIKEAMADYAWIEAMQKELHQFDILQVWELVDKPFGKNVIKLKWLWKNKKDENQIVIRNKARLVAKGYALGNRTFNPPNPHEITDVKEADCNAMLSAESENVAYLQLCSISHIKPHATRVATLVPSTSIARYHSSRNAGCFSVSVRRANWYRRCFDSRSRTGRS